MQILAKSQAFMKKLRRSCWREKERRNYIEIREQLPEYFSAERQVCYLPQSTFLVSSLQHDDTHAFSSCAPFWSHRPVSWQTAIYRSPFLLLFRVKQNTSHLKCTHHVEEEQWLIKIGILLCVLDDCWMNNMSTALKLDAGWSYTCQLIPLHVPYAPA